ncbi:MAG: hypothetical protein KDD55_06115, partial [Bdellovibrionales bacterium]|nr:hypothetical protein [Bdellovibrionales bacterium]
KTLPLADFVASAKLDQKQGYFSLRTLDTGASLKPYEVVEALTQESPFQYRVTKEKTSFLDRTQASKGA